SRAARQRRAQEFPASHIMVHGKTKHPSVQPANALVGVEVPACRAIAHCDGGCRPRRLVTRSVARRRKAFYEGWSVKRCGSPLPTSYFFFFFSVWGGGAALK